MSDSDYKIAVNILMISLIVFIVVLIWYSIVLGLGRACAGQIGGCIL